MNKKLPKFSQNFECKKILKILNEEKETSRYVGGCLRDFLNNKDSKDIDIATKIVPSEVIKILSKNGYKPIPTGINHGTVSVFVDGFTIEITTLRKDKNQDGRHSEVEFTDDWHVDASRRDFTINAIYMNEDGNLFDPFNGESDLKNKIVKFIGNPEERLNEDYLRILRYFRFVSIYESIIEEDVKKVLKNNKEKILDLSRERIHQEFFRILQSDNSGKIIEIIQEMEILEIIFNGKVDFEAYKRMINIDNDSFFEPNYLLRFFLLIPRDFDSIEALKNFNFSKKEKKILENLLLNKNEIKSYQSAKEVRARIYKLGIENFRNLVRIYWALDKKISNTIQWRALLAISETWKKPEFPIKSRDILLLGVPEGPLIGEILKEIEDWWIEADFINDKASLFERMKAIVNAKS